MNEDQEYLNLIARDDAERSVKKMEEKGYPKFQWSIFVKNGKDQQFVVRADTIEEFTQAKRDILSLIGEAVVEADGTPIRQVTPARENTAGVFCMTCKAPATQKSGVSRSGKPYNAIFCSTEDKTHTKWL